jgi:hypothetical protein
MTHKIVTRFVLKMNRDIHGELTLPGLDGKEHLASCIRLWMAQTSQAQEASGQKSFLQELLRQARDFSSAY